MNRRQHQEVADNAVAVQATGDVVIYQGISEERAHEIVRNAIDADLQKFERTAFQVAAARADQLRTELIERFRTVPDAQLGAFEDPDVQMLLTDAQREYVRSGADEHRAALIDLVAARTNATPGGMQASVIRSAVQTVPRMTTKSIPLATLSWLVTSVKASNVANRNWMAEWGETTLSKFTSHLPATDAEFRFMESLGVGTVGLGENDLADVFGTRYPGIFQNGRELESFADELIAHAQSHRIFIASFDDSNLVQLHALDAETAESELTEQGASPTTIEKYKEALRDNRKDITEIEQMLRASHSAWNALFDCWKGTVMRNFRLNFVGFAIAHCHYSNLVGDATDLSVWVPE